MPLGAEFSEIASNIFSDIKVMRFCLGFCLILVPLCTKFSETSPNISHIKRIPFQINLNNFRDLEKEDKVMRFNPGLCITLVSLCTKLGDDTSNNSSGIEWKPSFISCRLK